MRLFSDCSCSCSSTTDRHLLDLVTRQKRQQQTFTITYGKKKKNNSKIVSQLYKTGENDSLSLQANLIGWHIILQILPCLADTKNFAIKIGNSKQTHLNDNGIFMSTPPSVLKEHCNECPLL